MLDDKKSTKCYLRLMGSFSLFAAQFIAHSSFVYFLFSSSLWEWGVVALVYFCNGCIGMTATYHRLLSHRAWNCPPVVEYFGVLCATIGLTGSAISWVAIHRKHHKHTDEEMDPHSPLHKGFFYCQWLSMFESVQLRYVPDLVRQKFYLFQHRYYFPINFLYASVIGLIDSRALLYAWLVPACILWNAGSSIVTLSHLFGSNPHGLKCRARNLWPLGLVVFGEGWHNNHHAFPSRSRFSESLFQIDIGHWYIWLVTRFAGVWLTNTDSKNSINIRR